MVAMGRTLLVSQVIQESPVSLCLLKLFRAALLESLSK